MKWKLYYFICEHCWSTNRNSKCKFYFNFFSNNRNSLTTGIIKKLCSITRNKKKKHDKILTLAKSKLHSIETLVSQAFTDMEISHEEFTAIIIEKKYERMKENVKNVGEKQENTRLNSVNSKKNEFVNDLSVWLKVFF